MTWRSMTLRGLKTKQSGAYPSLRPYREVSSTSIVKAYTKSLFSFVTSSIVIGLTIGATLGP